MSRYAAELRRYERMSQEEFEAVRDTHRPYWAEDAAPVLVCFLDGHPWPCPEA